MAPASPTRSTRSSSSSATAHPRCARASSPNSSTTLRATPTSTTAASRSTSARLSIWYVALRRHHCSCLWLFVIYSIFLRGRAAGAGRVHGGAGLAARRRAAGVSEQLKQVHDQRAEQQLHGGANAAQGPRDRPGPQAVPHSPGAWRLSRACNMLIRRCRARSSRLRR